MRKRPLCLTSGMVIPFAACISVSCGPNACDSVNDSKISKLPRGEQKLRDQEIIIDLGLQQMKNLEPKLVRTADPFVAEI